ncbi:MAG TPA: ADP-heptose--LPS heptosyltransferase, partial [Rhodospirillales bacterium]|nr:ADP-heptose--LPS heptosyltransferase [Rhodospirillales bacterium]
RVYDLQTSERSSLYYFLFQPEPTPEWSGIARGCSHPHANPRRNDMHTFERQAEQLAMAGIDDVLPPDLSWAKADLAAFDLPGRYALVVPGGAAHRPNKRWPAAYFTGLARWLATQEITPLLLGGEAEKPLCEEIGEGCPEAVNLAGKTILAEIAALAKGAELALGNDTGPMHLIAAVGCRSVVLYSKASNPVLCGQRGARVEIIRCENLNELSVEEVTVTLMGERPS